MQRLSIIVLLLAIGTACKNPPPKPTFGDGDAAAEDDGSGATDDSGDSTAEDSSDTTDDTSTASTDGTDDSGDDTSTALFGLIKTTPTIASFALSDAKSHKVANNCKQTLWIQSEAAPGSSSAPADIKVEPGKKVDLVVQGAWKGKLWGHAGEGDTVALKLTKGQHRHLVFCAKK